MIWICIAIAGAAGALARHAINLAVGPHTFPIATLGINVAGSFLLGILLTITAAGRVPPQIATALAVGFLGAFTTYSTFSFEAFTLARTDHVVTAALYVAGSVALGLAAAAAGYRIGLRMAG